jgi:hypothetical protein
MSKLGYYFASCEKFGASAVVLQSNQSVVLRFPTGDRHASQQTPHAQVVAMVQEVAPPDLMDRLQRGPARFELEEDGRRFSVTVQLSAGSMAV